MTNNKDIIYQVRELGANIFAFMISDFRERNSVNTINCTFLKNGKINYTHNKIKFSNDGVQIISKTSEKISKEDISKIINGIDFQKPIKATCHKNTHGKLDENFWKHYVNQTMFILC